jgi:FG-GAP-like repeat/PASTA domain/FG-GAP repeat
VKRLAVLIGFLVVAGMAGAAGKPGSLPSFRAARGFDTSAKAAQSVALGDLNGDGKLDVVAAHGAESPRELRPLRAVSVLLGRGDGRFGPSHAFPTGKAGDELGAWSIAMGDLNGDGKPDVATGNIGANSVSVLVNGGHGTFEPPVNYPLGREPWDIAAADLNRDGKLDIATGNPNTVSVLLNNGDGAFGDTHEYPAGRSTWAFAVGDLNGDGRADIATANHGRSSTSVLINRGDGSFDAPVVYPTGPGPRTITIGDLNQDGKADVVTGNGSSDPNGNIEFLDGISVFLGKGDGTLRPKREYRPRSDTYSGLYFVSVRIGDVNGDRKPDLVTGNGSDDWAMSVFVNGGKGTFRKHFDYGWIGPTGSGVGLGSEAVALGDLNRDHKLDVVEPTWDEVSVFINAPGLCTVPLVEELKLSVARKRLAERNCRVGKIRWRRGGVAGYVSSQRPYAGAVLPKGSKVNLVVSTGGRS